jgi:hypothetical protein
MTENHVFQPFYQLLITNFQSLLLHLQPVWNVPAGKYESCYAKDEDQFQCKEAIQNHWVGQNQA